MLQYNIDKLNKYRENELLVCSSHPTDDLTIWNYSRYAQFSGHWDEITLSCRGLILDKKGNVVGLPFKKFFNLEEPSCNCNFTKDFEVFEKIDGSLGICYFWKDKWRVATRGSFISEQAQVANELLNKLNVECLNKDFTWLFEIIYPENRIVLDYGNMRELILLGARNIFNGTELNYNDLLQISNKLPCKIVKRFDEFNDYKSIKNSIPDDKEGYVVKFSNEDRIKIKGDEYCRLHKILTNLTTYSIWEALKNNDDLSDIIFNVPDEIDVKIKNYINDLKNQYKYIENYSFVNYNYIKNNTNDRKSFSKLVQETVEKKYYPIMFSLYDSKPIDENIWKMIKPDTKTEKI